MRRTVSLRKTDIKLLIYCGCSLFAGLLVLLLSRQTGRFGEWYASHVFPAFLDTIGRFFSIAPFSVFEVLLVALLVWLLVSIVYFLSLALVPRWRGMLKKAATRALCMALALVCSVFMMMSLMCNANFSRDALSDLMGRQVAAPSKTDLFELCQLLIEQLSELEGEIPTDSSGFFTVENIDVKSEARAAMKALGAEEPLFSGYYPNPKPAFFSNFMSMAGITGLFSPFTMEANYNKEAPGYQIPFAACHELAHLKGFIREDEAGFIAFLACMRSASAEFRYSGAMNALAYALSAYSSVATAEEIFELRETAPRQALGDFMAGSLYWKRYDGKIRRIANHANDGYLKANAQEDGVRSYGRMVDLLVAEYISKTPYYF